MGDFLSELQIDGTRIADDTECYVIAEIGHNHGGCVETCKTLFDIAKRAGCNAVKLQKRDNKHLYSPEMYASPYTGRNSYGATYGEHREALEFDFEQYQDLQSYAEQAGISFFATAFDVPSVKFLTKLGVPALKIASGDLTNIPLLKTIASTGLPAIFSTGGGTLSDVITAHKTMGNCPHAILHCTSGYPASFKELNLNVIQTYRALFPQTVIGWSGHDSGIAMSVAAYTLGARIIEKHFTLNRASKGTDHAFSLEPQGMAKMVRDLRRARHAMGDGIKRQYPSEIEPLKKQRKNALGQVDGEQAA